MQPDLRFITHQGLYIERIKDRDGWEMDRERERVRQADRQRDRGRERKKERHSDRDSMIEKLIETDEQTEKDEKTNRDRERERKRKRKRDRDRAGTYSFPHLIIWKKLLIKVCSNTTGDGVWLVIFECNGISIKLNINKGHES